MIPECETAARRQTKKKRMIKYSDNDDITESDKRLLDAIDSGDKAAFTELMRKYEGRLYNFGLKVCKNVTDAEDLVQETFVNVFKSISGFRQETTLKNWIYKIAANACWQMRRKSKFAPEKELSLESFMPEDHASIDKAPPAWASQPIEQLLNRELSDRIRTAVNELPERYKLVLVLRDMEGFSTQETATILEITEQNVKVRLHRARLFLREELKTYYGKE